MIAAVKTASQSIHLHQPRALSKLCALAIFVIVAFGALIQTFNQYHPLLEAQSSMSFPEISEQRAHEIAQSIIWVDKNVREAKTAQDKFEIAFGVPSLASLPELGSDKVKLNIQWKPFGNHMSVDPHDMTHSIMRGVRRVQEPDDTDTRAFFVFKLKEVATGSLSTQVVHLQFNDHSRYETHSIDQWVTSGPLFEGTMNNSMVMILGKVAQDLPVTSHDDKLYRLS